MGYSTSTAMRCYSSEERSQRYVQDALLPMKRSMYDHLLPGQHRLRAGDYTQDPGLLFRSCVSNRNDIQDVNDSLWALLISIEHASRGSMHAVFQQGFAANFLGFGENDLVLYRDVRTKAVHWVVKTGSCTSQTVEHQPLSHVPLAPAHSSFGNTTW